MKIIADEEEGYKLLGGGKISKEEQSQYMESYYGIIDARKKGNKEKEKECADKLLQALRTYLDNEINDLSDTEKETARLKEEGFSVQQIQTRLFTPEEIKSIREGLKEIWDSIDPEETDHILKVNLVSIQSSCLFSVYAKNAKREDELLYHKKIFNDFNYKNYKVIRDYFVLKSKVSQQLQIYSQQLQIYLSVYHIKVAGYDIDKKGFETYYLINMLPYISTTEMMDAWFEKNIWIIGFSTRYQYADGEYYSLLGFIKHDYEHARLGKNCYNVPFGGEYKFTINDYTGEEEYVGDKDENFGNDKNKSENYNLISEFYTHVKTKYKNNKRQLYSIKLIIFMGFHETGERCGYYFTNASDMSSAIQRLVKKLEISNGTNISSRFLDENDLYLSLPKRIREDIKEKKDGKTKEEIIVNYINVYCLTNFVNALKDFQLIKGFIKKGGKKQKKRKTKRKTKRNKKNRKTRRTG
jgi:hypothetical protein